MQVDEDVEADEMQVSDEEMNEKIKEKINLELKNKEVENQIKEVRRSREELPNQLNEMQSALQDGLHKVQGRSGEPTSDEMMQAAETAFATWERVNGQKAKREDLLSIHIKHHVSKAALEAVWLKQYPTAPPTHELKHGNNTQTLLKQLLKGSKQSQGLAGAALQQQLEDSKAELATFNESSQQQPASQQQSRTASQQDGDCMLAALIRLRREQMPAEPVMKENMELKKQLEEANKTLQARKGKVCGLRVVQELEEQKRTLLNLPPAQAASERRSRFGDLKESVAQLGLQLRELEQQLQSEIKQCKAQGEVAALRVELLVTRGLVAGKKLGEPLEAFQAHDPERQKDVQVVDDARGVYTNGTSETKRKAEAKQMSLRNELETKKGLIRQLDEVIQSSHRRESERSQCQRENRGLKRQLEAAEADIRQLRRQNNALAGTVIQSMQRDRDRATNQINTLTIMGTPTEVVDQGSALAIMGAPTGASNQSSAVAIMPLGNQNTLSALSMADRSILELVKDETCIHQKRNGDVYTAVCLPDFKKSGLSCIINELHNRNHKLSLDQVLNAIQEMTQGTQFRPPLLTCTSESKKLSFGSGKGVRGSTGNGQHRNVWCFKDLELTPLGKQVLQSTPVEAPAHCQVPNSAMVACTNHTVSNNTVGTLTNSTVEFEDVGDKCRGLLEPTDLASLSICGIEELQSSDGKSAFKLMLGELSHDFIALQNGALCPTVAHVIAKRTFLEVLSKHPIVTAHGNLPLTTTQLMLTGRDTAKSVYDQIWSEITERTPNTYGIEFDMSITIDDTFQSVASYSTLDLGKWCFAKGDKKELVHQDCTKLNIACIAEITTRMVTKVMEHSYGVNIYMPSQQSIKQMHATRRGNFTNGVKRTEAQHGNKAQVIMDADRKHEFKTTTKLHQGVLQRWDPGQLEWNCATLGPKALIVTHWVKPEAKVFMAIDVTTALFRAMPKREDNLYVLPFHAAFWQELHDRLQTQRNFAKSKFTLEALLFPEGTDDSGTTTTSLTRFSFEFTKAKK